MLRRHLKKSGVKNGGKYVGPFGLKQSGIANGRSNAPVLSLKRNGGRTMLLRVPNELSESEDNQAKRRRSNCYVRVHEPKGLTH